MAQIGEPAGAVRRERTRTTRGALAPNPHARRWTAAHRTMASPPTVTPGVGAVTTQIPGSVLHRVDAATVRVIGAAVSVTATGTYAWFAPTNPEFDCWGYEFEHDGIAFEIPIRGKDSYYRLMVDGEFVTTAPQAGPSSANEAYLHHVAFGSRAVRRIRIEALSGQHLGGVRVGPTDGIWTPNTPPGPRVIVAGDSWTEGTGATGGAIDGLAARLRDLTGWDTWTSGHGGTGYLNSTPTLGTRLDADVLAYDPDIVIVAMGTNDYLSYTPLQIQTEAALVFARILAHSPRPTLIVVGPWYISGFPSNPFILARDAIRAAASVADLYVENVGGPYPFSGNGADYADRGWITGTGRVGATTGNGNADVYIASDGSHPTTAGHAMLARRIASAILEELPL